MIPTLNEEASIGGVVRALPRDWVSRVIVADGGSSDATAARAREAGAEVIAAGRGYGRACLAGAEAASDAEIVMFMDGDGADDPASIGALVGSDPLRRIRLRDRVARARDARARQHRAGIRSPPAGSPVSACACSTACATPTCARSARSGASVCSRLGMREMTYGWNIEMQMRAARAGLRILEIPVPYRRRTGGDLEGRRQPVGHASGRRRASSRLSCGSSARPLATAGFFGAGARRMNAAWSSTRAGAPRANPR